MPLLGLTTRLARAMAAVTLAVVCACARSGDVPAARAYGPPLDPCPRGGLAASEWTLVRAAFEGLSFRVPGSAEHTHTERDRWARGENWIVEPSGLQISYRLYREPIGESVPDDAHNPTICEESIAGLRAEVRAYYSRRTYIPGEYLSATWALPDGRSLSILLVAPDSTFRDQLFGIIRSVRFAH